MKTSPPNCRNPQPQQMQTLKVVIRQLKPDRIEFAEDHCHRAKSALFAIPPLAANDEKAYNKGGIGRCSENNADAKLKCAMEKAMNDEGHKHHAGANRLKVILGGTSYIVTGRQRNHRQVI